MLIILTLEGEGAREVREKFLIGGRMSEYILEMENIRKEFLGGKVIANEDITLKVKKGEIHAIVGENGAGKSTLMKMLNGLYEPTSGKILYKGKEPGKVKINFSRRQNERIYPGDGKYT